MQIKISPYLTFNADGTFTLSGNKDGMPEVTAVVPAPDVNTKDEKERERRHREACDGITLGGYYIISTKLIRNKTFDDPGQMTTLQVVYRPCKTEDECKEVMAKFYEIVARLMKEKEDAYTQKMISENPSFLEID